MTNTVTFSVSVGGDGSTVTDDSNVTTGLGNGGHRTRFVPCLSQTVAVAAYVVAQAAAAAVSATASAASAASAAISATTGAAASTGTSVTSLAIGTGTKTLTSQAGKTWVGGMVLKFYADATDYMIGTVTAYNSSTGVLSISVPVGDTVGSGTFASWVISVSPLPFIGGTLTTALNEAPGVTIASAATVNVGAAAANTITISGVVTISAFDSIASGAFRRTNFTGILQLTHNASSFILLTGANITTAVGDWAEWESTGSGNWVMTSYTRKDGTSLTKPSLSVQAIQYLYANAGAM